MRNKTSTFSVGLDTDHIERLLCQSLLRRTKDAELVALISEFEGLGARCHSQGLENCQDELNNASTMLAICLDALPALPAQIVLQVHSAIGLIYEAQGQYNSAIQSYLRAFWVASAAANIPQEQLGCVLHRLGNAYSLSGKYQMGRSLIEKATKIYEKAHLDKKSCMEEAVETLKVLDYGTVIFNDSIEPLARPKGRSKRREAFFADAHSKKHAEIVELLRSFESPSH
jgi:tetratricopeptide (TPR) repeat protein